MKGKDKELIIKEYFLEDISYGKLAKRHGLSKQIVWLWVKEHKQKHGSFIQSAKEMALDNQADGHKKVFEKTLLEVQLLREILAIAEKELGIDIRKKYGAKQS